MTSKDLNTSLLYCFGGDHSSTVSCMNVSTGRWKSVTRMLTPRSFFSGAMIDHKIYIIGGHTGNKILSTMELYDCLTNTWTQLCPMPESRYWCAAVAHKGFIYVAGGKDSLDKPLSSVIRYNVRTDQWEAVSSMDNARSNHQLVELDDRLYAICGHNMDTVEEYDPSTDQWRAVSWTKYPHSWFGAAVHSGKIYICSDNGFEVYSPILDIWNTLTRLNRYVGRKLIPINGKLWAVGGGRTNSVFEYDISTEKWSQLPDMDVDRENHCLFLVNS